ncbi:MAG TPA: AraD1 family protein [Candidatus Acidoferrum sp.]
MGNVTRLVQIQKGQTRRVALVEEPLLRLLNGSGSVYELAQRALADGVKLTEAARQKASSDTLDYDPIYRGDSDWRLLPAIDHPEETSRCLVSGTGLTHLGSAQGRQSMHAVATQEMTDSMKMFSWGIEGGKPAAGAIGAAPEWFHKGTGRALRAHNEPIEVPAHAEDGGEEGEVAGIYIIAADGQPRRIGMAGGNEFSDHQFEKKNYLNLAGSKLRSCALGPELVIDPKFESVGVEVAIQRNGSVLWSRSFQTGEAGMCHSLQNIEHHHFKFEAHRRPGDVHVHFFGIACLSFSDGVRLQDGDVMQVAFEGFGRPLRNPVKWAGTAPKLVSVIPLG